MLVKMTPRVNFINVLQAAFTQVDPKSAKRLTTLENYEIDTSSQFYQHFTHKFFIPTPFWQLFLVTFWLWGEIRMKNLHVNVDGIDTCFNSARTKSSTNTNEAKTRE